MEQIHLDFPNIPRGTAPPYVIFQAQAIFSASIAASAFSAFLAILGTQWLWNRHYTPTGMQTAVEHTEDRQRTPDGIVTWYMDYVMGSLPADVADLAVPGRLCNLSLLLGDQVDGRIV